MKHMTWNKKRMMGTTLAALTLVAGMSAVSFAGEPATTAATSIVMKAKTINMDLDTAEMKDLKDLKNIDGAVDVVDMMNKDGIFKMTVKNPDDGDAPVVSFEAKEVKTKVDEAGDTYWSFDDGETWDKVVTEEGEAGNMVFSIEATPTTEAEI